MKYYYLLTYLLKGGLQLRHGAQTAATAHDAFRRYQRRHVFFRRRLSDRRSDPTVHEPLTRGRLARLRNEKHRVVTRFTSYSISPSQQTSCKPYTRIARAKDHSHTPIPTPTHTYLLCNEKHSQSAGHLYFARQPRHRARGGRLCRHLSFPTSWTPQCVRPVQIPLQKVKQQRICELICWVCHTRNHDNFLAFGE